jgi:hypothetical protein
MISSALDIAGDDQTPTIGPAATDSLERRGKMTSVSARETVPQPDANHAEQKWDLGGSCIFIRRYSLWSSCCCMNGVGDGHGEEPRQKCTTGMDEGKWPYYLGPGNNTSIPSGVGSL